jgi:hypothetical protein
MNISWGTKITILYLAFVTLIIVMVSKAMQQKIDLESADYYQQELEFQNKINLLNRTRALSESLTWELKNNNLLLKFPESFKQKEIEGNIYFFRPSDSEKDKTVSFSKSDTTSVLIINTSNLSSGIYKIRLNWSLEGNSYLDEGVIQLK